MKFVKNYVRVEALALQRALELQKETDRSHLYLASSQLHDESGWAVDLANHGEEIRDLGGKVVGRRELAPAQLGLEGEIDEFTAPDMSGRSERYLERLYLFSFNDPETHKGELYVFIKIVKQDRNSDWEIILESAWKKKITCGFRENLFYRDNEDRELVH